MMPIAVLRNDPAVPPGYLADALASRPWTLVELDRGEALPALDSVGGVAVLGGLMGAYDEDDYPYLADEKRFLGEAIEADVPVLGICLGAQLLAEATGGKAYRADAPEATYAPVRLTEAGLADPVASQLGDRHVMRFHQDTWDLPPDAIRLADGGGFEQVFRIGSGLGLQLHPEVGPEILSAWLSHAGVERLARRAGAEPGVLISIAESFADEGERTAGSLFGAWLAQC